MNLLRQFLLVAIGLALPMLDACADALLVKPLAEKRVPRLPEGTLVWRIETFPSLDKAKAAEGPWSLSFESAGKAWLFTLGSSGRTPQATKVAEVGPICRIEASEYLLRINDASGAPGSMTSIHSHPGSEAYFVLEGQQSIRGAHGTLRVNAGHSETGIGADQAMQVSSSGSTNLHALVMFVVDANRPFSTLATLP